MLLRRLRSIDSGYVESIITGEKWSFTYCKAGHVWGGELDKSEVESSAKEVGLDVDEFTKTALSIFGNSCPKEFIIDLKPIENDNIDLSWKKITVNGIKFSLGSVLLKKQDPKEGDAVFANAIASISDLEKELESYKARNFEVEAHNERISAHLDEFARQKVELESQLFTKFALMLNEKKAKIRTLKEKLQQFESTHSARIESTEETSDSNQQKPPESKAVEKKSKIEHQVKRKNHSRITVGDDFELSISKIPRRGRRQKETAIETRGGNVPSTSAKQVPVTEYVDDDMVKPVKDEVDCDDTVDASDLLDDL